METSRDRTVLALVMILVTVVLVAVARARPSTAAAAGIFRSSSVMFIENAGQWDSQARFQLWGGPTVMWLADDAIWLNIVDRATEEATHGAFVKLSFDGANPGARLVPFDRLDTIISYFRGNDPAQWRAAVPVWGGGR